MTVINDYNELLWEYQGTYLRRKSKNSASIRKQVISSNTEPKIVNDNNTSDHFSKIFEKRENLLIKLQIIKEKIFETKRNYGSF